MAQQRMVGGLGEEKAPTDDIKTICEELKEEILQKSDKKASSTMFEVVHFKSQVVAGANYFVKIKVNEGEYVHARIFQPLPHTGNKSELTSVQSNKKHDDPLEYF